MLGQLRSESSLKNIHLYDPCVLPSSEALQKPPCFFSTYTHNSYGLEASFGIDYKSCFDLPGTQDFPYLVHPHPKLWAH